MSKQIDLDELFPPAPEHEKRTVQTRQDQLTEATRNRVGRAAREEISTRWASIYTLELRGLDKKQIAEQLGVAHMTVIRATADDRYIAYREAHLAALDHEFVEMKPLAFSALKNGLRSSDENTALRASEQWFKGASYGGFSKEPAPTAGTTAEDVARQLLQSAVQVNVQVNVEK